MVKFGENKLSTFFKFSRKHAVQGSILLEIAIGISVLAIISGFFIRKTMIANKYMREQLTKSNIETITISLASFVANNKRLPRPSETNDGVESNSLNSKSGYVPYKTLGISSKIAKDGDLQPLVYIVEPRLTNNYSRIYGDELNEDIFCMDIPSPQISIQGIFNQKNSTSQNLNKDVIAFVIDTNNHQNVVGEFIMIYPTAHTFWITRDMLLMRYLKHAPCVIENPQRNFENSQRNPYLQEFVDDF